MYFCCLCLCRRVCCTVQIHSLANAKWTTEVWCMHSTYMYMYIVHMVVCTDTWTELWLYSSVHVYMHECSVTHFLTIMWCSVLITLSSECTVRAHCTMFLRITSGPLEAEVFQSSHSLEDSELKVRCAADVHSSKSRL